MILPFRCQLLQKDHDSIAVTVIISSEGLVAVPVKLMDLRYRTRNLYQISIRETPCNNARAKRVRIVFCDRAWRDQPRGKTKGGAAPEVFSPRLIPTHEVGKTL